MHKPWRSAQHPRRTIRDFHRARYGNPLFNRQKTAQHRVQHNGHDRRPLFFATLAAIITIGAVWYALWGPAFLITSVEVNGVSGPPADAVRAGVDQHLRGASFLIFPRANILVFDKTKALADIGSKVYLDSITIRKKLPNTLEVEVYEKTTRAALSWNNRLFALDESGSVVRELVDKEIASLGDLPPGVAAVPVLGLGAETVEVEGLSPKGTVPPPAQVPQPTPPKTNPFPLIIGEEGEKQEAVPGKAMFTTATMHTILQAHVRLPDIAGSAVRWFHVQESSETVEADMAGDWRILLATATAFDVQAERLGIVLKEKIGAKKPSLEYIDLRYKERIFFRFKDATSSKN